MDFSAKLEELQAKANETVATARAAATENRDQFKQRVEKAQSDAKQAMQDTKQQANEAVDRAESKCAQCRRPGAVSLIHKTRGDVDDVTSTWLTICGIVRCVIWKNPARFTAVIAR